MPPSKSYYDKIRKVHLPGVRDKIRKCTSTGNSTFPEFGFASTSRWITAPICLKMSEFNQVKTNYILMGNEIGGGRGYPFVGSVRSGWSQTEMFVCLERTRERE